MAVTIVCQQAAWRPDSRLVSHLSLDRPRTQHTHQATPSPFSSSPPVCPLFCLCVVVADRCDECRVVVQLLGGRAEEAGQLQTRLQSAALSCHHQGQSAPETRRKTMEDRWYGRKEGRYMCKVCTIIILMLYFLWCL